MEQMHHEEPKAEWAMRVHEDFSAWARSDPFAGFEPQPIVEDSVAKALEEMESATFYCEDGSIVKWLKINHENRMYSKPYGYLFNKPLPEGE